MGLLSAMNKSVGGLNAQSFALENISGNIANSQTTAFKRTDTSFMDLVGAGTSRVSMMAAGNVRANARSTIGLQGAIEDSSVETFMGIKGNGFFAVKQKDGEQDGASVFSAGMAYTRRGDFQINKEGYLVNGAGYFLAGLTIDKNSGNPVGDIPDTIRIDKSPITAEGTTKVTYKLNLPETPFTNNYTDSGKAAGSDIWATPTDTVSATNEQDFIDNSISGGAVTVYDANGTALNMQIRWAKTGDDKWQAYYQSDSTATGATTKWTALPGDGAAATSFTFNADGSLATPDPADLSLTNFTINGSNLGTVTLAMDGTLTQAANTSGAATVQQLTQDGLPAGDFKSVSITDGGRVVANYSNGKTVDIYQIPLMSFQGEAQLKPMDGGAYAETRDSGPPASTASGQVVGASLENSNVDIGEEFTKLIVTQQAFSANSKVISTADNMMTDILNIIR